MDKCTKCGSSLEHEAKFCSNCGAKVYNKKKKSTFNKIQKANAEVVYEDLKSRLKPRDGKIHVLMINSFSKFINQIFCFEDKYTTQIDRILEMMQDDGYEIVDIKFNIIPNQGITGTMEGFFTLITYK